MEYQITALSDELYLIRWYSSPPVGSPANAQYIAEIKELLDEVPHPVYFISDLRYGRITDVATLQKLGKLTKHPNLAGSAAFSKDPMSSIFVELFSRFSPQSNSENEMWDTPEEAIAFLESLKEGLTQDIDWNSVLGSSEESSTGNGPQ